MGVHLTGVHLMGVHLMGVHLVCIHLTGVHLTGISVYFTDRGLRYIAVAMRKSRWCHLGGSEVYRCDIPVVCHR
jgi:hypothetical protein